MSGRVDRPDRRFVFGFSKLDVMFGRTVAGTVHHPYRDLVKPGVRFVQTTVRAIDPSHAASRPTQALSRPISGRRARGRSRSRCDAGAARRGTRVLHAGVRSPCVTCWPTSRVAE